jgi:hypothetical protein
MKFARAWALLSLLVIQLMILFPTNTSAQAQFFGMHMNMNTDPWPTGQVHGSDRMWNAWGAQRLKVNPAEGVYDWDDFDKFLAGARAAGIDDILYTLSDTPDWASQRGSRCKGPGDPDDSCTGPADTVCEIHAMCYTNADLKDDGTGTDQTWKDWVTAVATHANSLDPTKYAHIGTWEIWNEFFRNKGFPHITSRFTWLGTYNQLIRMAQDARAIIQSIDPNALIATPSSTVGNVGSQMLANFLYCNQNPLTQCTMGSAGSEAVDIINDHAYETDGEPENLDWGFKNLKSYLSETDRQKPLWITEGGWGRNTNLPEAALQVGFIARWRTILLNSGVARSYWYGYDFADSGTLWNNETRELTPAGVADQQLQKWLDGQSFGGCTTESTVWSCPVGLNLMVWDSAGNSDYSTKYWRYTDLAGESHAVQGGKVTIGLKPILLSGDNLLSRDFCPTGFTDAPCAVIPAIP